MPTAGLALFGIESSRSSQDWEPSSLSADEIVTLFQMALNSMLVRQDQPRFTTSLSMGDQQPLTQVPALEFEPLPGCRSTSPEISSWTQKVKKIDGHQTKELYLESAELPLVFNLLRQAGVEPAQLQGLGTDLPQIKGKINLKELLARVATNKIGTEPLCAPTDNLSTGPSPTGTNQHLAHNLKGESLTLRRISPEQLPQWQALLQRAGLSPHATQEFFAAPQIQQAGLNLEKLNNWVQEVAREKNSPAHNETTPSVSTSNPTYRRIWEGLALSSVDLPRLRVLLQQAGAPTAALTALDNQAISPQAPLRLAEIWSTLRDHQIRESGDRPASGLAPVLTKITNPSSTQDFQTDLGQLLRKAGMEPAMVEKLVAQIDLNAGANKFEALLNLAPPELAPAKEVREPQPLYFMTQFLNQDRSTATAATPSGQPYLNQEAPLNRDNIHSIEKLWTADLSDGQEKPDRVAAGQNSTRTDWSSGPGYADSRTGQANHLGGLPEPSSSPADHTALRQLLTDMGVEAATVEKLVSQLNYNATELKPDLFTATASSPSAQPSFNQEAPTNRNYINFIDKLWKADLSGGQKYPECASEGQNSTQTDLSSGHGNVDLGNGSRGDRSAPANAFTAGMASAPAGASNTLVSGSVNNTAPGSGLTTWEQLHQQLKNGIFNHLQPGQTQVRLALNPPNLGELNLNLSLKGNLLRVVAETSNPAVAQAMEGRLAELQQSLGLQGLALEEFSVCLSANHLPETMLSFNGLPVDQKPVSKTAKGEMAAGGQAGKPKGKDKSSPRISHYA